MIREWHVEVTRTARVCTLGEQGPGLSQIWMVCHGYGQLAGRFLRRFEVVADSSRLIAAPEALNRFYLDARPVRHGPGSAVGATWMTREDRLTDMDDYVRYLDAVHERIMPGVDNDRVELIALGFSQGMSTVARWAARTTARVDRLVLWAGSWPPELEPGPGLFGNAHLHLVVGRTDPAVNEQAVDALAGRLRAGGLEPDVVWYDGGHDVDERVLTRLAGAERGTSRLDGV